MMNKQCFSKMTCTFGIAVLCFGSSAATGAVRNMQLEIKLPPPLAIGTPVEVKVDHLEPAEAAEKRAPVMVPENAVNVARGQSVTSSDTFPIIGELDFITDGYKEGDEGNYVELGPGVQWVQIDLGRPCRIYAVAVWHYFSQERAYHDVIIQTSNDPEFKEGVLTHFNNDHDNSSGFGIGKDLAYVETNRGRVIPVDGVPARYVRLYSRGNTANQMNHYIEVEVYGVSEE